MNFYDVLNKNNIVSFKEAVTQQGSETKSSIFMPLELKKISPALIYRDPPPSFRDLAFDVIKQFCSEEISDIDLMQIIAQFFPHKMPVNPIAPTTYTIELFNGQTCNYKDIASGFFAQLLEHFNKNEEKPFNLIIAASGERACALASAFSKTNYAKLFILYPQNSLTKIQKSILLSSGKNIFSLAVDGSLEECSKLVNKILCDKKLAKSLNLIPAGIFNIAHLLPQIAFFVYASLSVLYRCGYDNRIEHPAIIASMPSGSFSSLTAGLFAKKMGAPITGFISAENENRVISEWLGSEDFKNYFNDNRDSLSTAIDQNRNQPIKTNTPALDVANPVNFIRMLELYPSRELQELIVPYWLTNNDTIQAIRNCADRTGYIIDPYGAMAWQAWDSVHRGAEYKNISTWANKTEKRNLIGLILQTSHPGKFSEIMKPAIGRPPSLPDRLASLPNPIKKETKIQADYYSLKEWLLDFTD